MWGGNKMGSSMAPSYGWETGGIINSTAEKHWLSWRKYLYNIIILMSNMLNLK